MILGIATFALGFMAGAITNEVQKRGRGKCSPQIEREAMEREAKEKAESESDSAVNDIEEPVSNSIVSPTDTRQSYVNYNNPEADIVQEADWVILTKTEYDENEAKGLASEYENIELYFNIKDGECTDVDNEVVNSWDDLVGPLVYKKLNALIGKAYEGLSVNKRHIYVKNNIHDAIYHINVIEE